MDKHHREELKKDQFVETIGQSVGYVSSHRQQAFTYAGIALAALAIAAGVYYYTQSKRATEQATLAQALQIKSATIGVAGQPGDPRPSFPTEEEKNKALIKALTEVVTKHPGSDAAAVAHFQLGVTASDSGKMDEAAKQFEQAVATGSREYASAARLALGQVYPALGKMAEAEKVLRELMASPSNLVSKEQATFTLARVLSSVKPEEARKLIDPLQKDSRPAIARSAVALYAEIPGPPAAPAAPPAAK